MARDAEKIAAQAERISELRAAGRIGQQAVADAVGVTLRAYQRWEAGDSDIGGENLKKLATYFGTTPDFIEYGSGARAATPDPFAAKTDSLEAKIDRMAEQVNELHDLLLGDGPDAAELLDGLADRLLQGAESPPKPSSARTRSRAAVRRRKPA